MQKIKVSAVSYLNSAPFIYGLNYSEIKNEIDLSLDIPSDCAQKLLFGRADIGLIPVAAIPEMKEAHIVTDFCIGAKGKVNSVVLLSEVPLKEIKSVLLDYQSRTSAQLTKIICSEHWNIHPEFLDSYEGFEKDIKEQTSGLVIGDRALILKKKFGFVYDLAEAWNEMTSLPFVFACWVSNKKQEKLFIEEFNEALKYGLQNIDMVISENKNPLIPLETKEEYLKKNISYDFDEEKKERDEIIF